MHKQALQLEALAIFQILYITMAMMTTTTTTTTMMIVMMLMMMTMMMTMMMMMMMMTIIKVLSYSPQLLLSFATYSLTMSTFTRYL